jgi:NTP pyrophosphatase (non-canonical NTP hydrolase)
MDIETYLEERRKLEQKKFNLFHHVLGLCEESGEVAGVIKKSMYKRDKLTDEDKHNLKLELGDVLWYLCAICDKLEFNLLEVASENIIKLKDRYPQNK